VVLYQLTSKHINTNYNSQLGNTDRGQVNLEARRLRQKSVFTNVDSINSAFKKMTELVSKPIEQIRKKKSAKILTPKEKLFKSYALVLVGIFLIGSATPQNSYSASSGFVGEEPDLTGLELATFDVPLITDQAGYISKINPQTESGDRSTMFGKLVHTVSSGETISVIANSYGLKTKTVLWENGLSETSKIRAGDKLIIPPVDGVSHSVKKGQDIKKIAGLYSVNADSIIKQNGLSADSALVTDQVIYIPGGKPLVEQAPRVIVRNANTGTSSRSNIGSTTKVKGGDIGSPSADEPAVGKTLIMPTKAVLTQGYRAGHYALDLANPSKPPIWAAADGVVVKASSGTWGGGYGNHIIVDHGNGMKTLYAHLEYLSVSVGDSVTQGQVIGKMGRTGNVRGRTGIHLHFEVMVNGKKKNPYSYI